MSYQLASTYKVDDRYLFRAVHSRSNSGSFLNNTIDVQQVVKPIPEAEIYVNNFSKGNPELKLAKVTMSEIGFRGQLTQHVQVDIELFRQRIEDTYTFATTRQTYQPTGLPQPAFLPDTIQRDYVNHPLTAVQNGATLSVNYIPNARFQLRPFITLQRTQVNNLSLALNTLPLDSANGTNLTNLSTTIDARHESTPSVFGGTYLNFAATSRLNANVNVYFFGKQTMYAEVDQDFTRESDNNDLQRKILVNAKLSYRLVDKLSVYGTVKNLLSNDSREHYGTDRIGRSFFGGVSYNF